MLLLGADGESVQVIDSAADLYPEQQNVDNEIESKRQAIYEQYRPVMNVDTGNITQLSNVAGTDNIAYVVKGKVVYDEDGNIDYDRSDDTIYYKVYDKDGNEVDGGTPKPIYLKTRRTEFGKVLSDVPIEEYVDNELYPQEQNNIQQAINNSQTNVEQSAPAESVTPNEYQEVTEKKDSTEFDENGGYSNIQNTVLSEEEADLLMSAMEQNAEAMPVIELTPDNWVAEFGQNRTVSTPIGDVKMGDNQLAKLFLKKRTREFGMIKPTLINPDVIIEKTAVADNAERNTKLLFVKTFKDENGQKHVHFENVTVQKGGLEVSISSHIVDKSAIRKELANGIVIYNKPELTSIGSDVYLTETHEGQSDIVPTQKANSDLQYKGTINNLNEQGEFYNSLPRNKKGEVDENQMSAEQKIMYAQIEFGQRADLVRDYVAEQSKALSEKIAKLTNKAGKSVAEYKELAALQQDRDVFADYLNEWQQQEQAMLRHTIEEAAADSEEHNAEEKEQQEQSEAGTETADDRGRTEADIAEAVKEIDVEPTEAQKKAGNYKKGHVKIQGFDITIENPKGAIRKGVDDNGKAWSTEMKNHYGYFKNTEGKDGDHIDVFIGDNPNSKRIFVVDQVNPKTKEFDESKVMLGFDTEDEAKKAYLSNYSKDWKGFKDITYVDVDTFRDWLYDGAKQRKPFGEYSNIRFRSIKDINDRFNEELQQQIDGTLPKGHVYSLGMPNDILRSAGFPNVPIELSASHLEKKSIAAQHPFELKEIKSLVKALQDPMAVFAYGDKKKSQNVIVEIQHEGKNFVVGIHFNRKRGSAEISSIRGLYPKDNAEWLNWISQGKLLYVNKEKIQISIDQQRRNLADVEYLDLNYVAKVIKDFDNPTLSGEKNEETRFLSDISEIKPLVDKINGGLLKLKRMDTEGVYDLLRSVAELNNMANKGYYYLNVDEKLVNDEIYSLKERAVNKIAQELYNRDEYVGFDYNGVERFHIVYFRDKQGRQISFHQYVTPEYVSDFTPIWDGITESWKDENIKFASKKNAELEKKKHIISKKVREEYFKEIKDSEDELERDINNAGEDVRLIMKFGTNRALSQTSIFSDKFPDIAEQRKQLENRQRDVNKKLRYLRTFILKKESVLSRSSKQDTIEKLKSEIEKIETERTELRTESRLIENKLNGIERVVSLKWRGLPEVKKATELAERQFSLRQKHFLAERDIVEKMKSATREINDKYGDNVNEEIEKNIRVKAERDEAQQENKKLEELVTLLKKTGFADVKTGEDFYNALAEIGDKEGSRFMIGKQATEADVRAIADETSDIKAKAISDGTFMKAPNGKDTNLTERQWLQVRTKAFKKWFGDWENAYKLELIENLQPIGVDNKGLSRERAEEEYKKIGTSKTNRYDNRRIEFVNNAFGKIARHKNSALILDIIPQLNDLFESAIPIYFEEEREPLKSTNIVGSHNYLGKVRVNDEDYYVRITTQELTPSWKQNEKQGKSNFHNMAVSDIAIYDESGSSVTAKDYSIDNDNRNRFVDAKLQHFFETAREARENSSKVVDENGEPMVVYHGSGVNNITTFYDGGMFFARDIEVAKGYAGENGVVYQSFLKLTNPLIENAAYNNWSDLRPELEDYKRYRIIDHDGDIVMDDIMYEQDAETYALDMAYEEASYNDNDVDLDDITPYEYESYYDNENITTNDFWSFAIEKGYDGVIIKNITDSVDEETFFHTDVFITSFPAQIKSATDNIGTFDGENEDIRYMRPNGTVLGFVKGNTIYLNPDEVSLNTPIHEFGHLWVSQVKGLFPELWAKGKELFLESDYLRKVQADPNYQHLDLDGQIDEAMARAIGDRGEQELDKTLLEKILDWIAEVWEKIGGVFGIDNLTSEQISNLTLQDFTDMATSELLSGENLTERVNGNRGGATRYNIADETADIKAKSIADGTFMKAPNGKDTNLTERQWLQVRTKAFKKWFGDWEKTARIEKLKKTKPIEITGEEYKGKYELNVKSGHKWILDNLRGTYTIKDTGEKVNLSRVSANEITSHGEREDIHLKSFAVIPQMIENAIFIEETDNYKSNNKYDKYKYYVVGLNVDGVPYTARIVVGEKNGKTYYDHELTQIEKGTIIDSLNGTTTSVAKNANAFSEYKDNRLFSLLQTNSSKVVDENGEPMVVYHGTNKFGFTVFDKEFSDDKTSIFFTDRVDIAKGYAGVNADVRSLYDDDTAGGYSKDEMLSMLFADVDISSHTNGWDVANDILPYITEDIGITAEYDDEDGVLTLSSDYTGDTYRLTDEEFSWEKVENWLRDNADLENVIDKNAGIYGVFVNARNVLDIDAGGSMWAYIPKEKVKGVEGVGNMDTRDIVEHAKKLNYDGVYIKDLLDTGGRGYGLVGDIEGDIFISLVDKNQIKSATDNIGTFNEEDEDIRYSVEGADYFVNERFNEQLEHLTESNADSTIFYLGEPSAEMLAVGIKDSPLKLYGNKLQSKAKKHGFDVKDVKDLPEAIHDPIAIFEGAEDGSFAILTELSVGDNNVLATLSVGKGNDVDFNIVSSVYGKYNKNVVGWINKGKTLYVNKEKALDYLRISAPIAEAQDKGELNLSASAEKTLDWFAMEAPKASSQTQQELITATKVIENFENPPINEKKVVDDTTNDMVRYSIRANDQLDREDEIMGKKAAEIYEARVKLRKQMNQSDPKKMPNKEIFDEINRKTENRRAKIAEHAVDCYLPMKHFIETLNKHGYNIADYNNWYMNVFSLASKNEAEYEKYQAERSVPLQRAAKAAMDSGNITYRDLENYLILKHGQERNEYFTERDKGLGIEPLKDVDREDTRLY